MTPPKKTLTPKSVPTTEAPVTKLFRLIIVTRKETIMRDLGAYANNLTDAQNAIIALIREQGGYIEAAKDGLGNPANNGKRWIPLHMIEQVEVIEIRQGTSEELKRIAEMLK